MKPADLIKQVISASSVYADDKRLVIDGHEVPFTCAPAFEPLPDEGWVAINQRRPPDDDRFVYAWNPRVNQPIVCRASILNAQFSQMVQHDFRKRIEQEGLLLFTGYFATHWRPAHGGPA